MINRFTISFILLLPYFGFSQRFQFQANEEPQELFKRVFAEIGLSNKNIIVRASNDINNAEARIENRKRYIIYNESWMQEIGSTSSDPKNWLKMGIISHELGHHMLGHTLEFDQTNSSLELEADIWSGYLLYKLGASLDQALLAVQSSPNYETQTHPSRDRRIVAVTEGYNNGKSLDKKRPIANSSPSSSKNQAQENVKKSYLKDNEIWLTENLNLEISGSWCYKNDESFCEIYGRLYIWEAAIEACALLGKGWRLPTDKEWQTLAKLYGGVAGVGVDSGGAKDKGKKAYNALYGQGSSGFDAQLGGWRNPAGQFGSIGQDGVYWSRTSNKKGAAWYYYFVSGTPAFARNLADLRNAYSVRCIKD